MTTALSLDLRKRVVAAVEHLKRDPLEFAGARDGRHPAATGGRRQAARIEAFAPVILGAVEAKPDVTLAEIRELLSERGASFAQSTIWRFFAHHKIT